MASEVSVGDNQRDAKRKNESGVINSAFDDATASTPPSSPPYNFSPTSQVVIHTPTNAIQPINGSQLSTPLSNSTSRTMSRLHSAGGSMEMLEGGSGVSVDFEVGDGEYVVKIKKRRITSTNDEEHNVEDTKQLAQSAGMLFLQAQILRDMGDQLLAQYRESLQYVIQKSGSRIDFTQN